MTGPVAAVSLWQPWAALVAAEAKRIETRSWAAAPRRLEIGDLLAVHAARKRPPTGDVAGGSYRRGAGPNGEDRFTLYEPTEDRGEGRLHALDLNDSAFGTVVAVARFAGCVRMIERRDPIPLGGGLLLDHAHVDRRPVRATLIAPGPKRLELDVTDQLPFGHFARDRFAWLLSEIVPLDPPIPAVGRQRVFRLDAAASRAVRDAHRSGRS